MVGVMTASPPDLDDAGLPALLRGARRAYRDAIRAAYADAGFDDMPRNGAFLLARVYDGRTAVGDLARELGISKQAVSQLIDTMVMRGYLQRSPAAEDRRRVELTFTERGDEAATAGWHAATAVDERLAGLISADGVAAVRAGLIALCGLASSGAEAAAGD